MKRRILDSIHDRLWVELTARTGLPILAGAVGHVGSAAGSISGTMAWPVACAGLVASAGGDPDFRRRQAVRDVVETLGPSDGRYHARRVKSVDAGLLDDPRVLAAASWGNPIRWPGVLLGTSRPFSPSSLRYLSHAVWLKRHGLVQPGGTVIEIGIGYGGLAAMNAIISGVRTLLVDLDPVKDAAWEYLQDLGLGHHRVAEGEKMDPGNACLVSNYAFSELSRCLQDMYMDQYFAMAAHGMIVSNAAVFAGLIGGRSDAELVDCLRARGIAARLSDDDEILGPSDYLSRVRLIWW